MAIKETKRKGFNFFRSYFDVYNELPTKKSKLEFIDALLNKQFLNKEPKNLSKWTKFAWVSQFNSIDNQVKGYETKTGTTLTPSVGVGVGVKNPPSLQVEVEVEEKVEEKEKGGCFFAFDFLKENSPIELESLKMKFDKKISDWDEFILNFNCKVDEEELNYTSKILLSRFTRMANNWKKKEKSFAQKEKPKSRLDEFIGS